MLDFLKAIKVDDPATMKKHGGGGGGPRKAWNPEGDEIKAIRIWKDGSIFPSKKLVEWFGLEYRDKGAEAQGNGLDVFSSEKLPIFKAPKPLLVINVVDRDKPRIDLFGTVGYDEAGEPTSSVLDQGATTFGTKTLLPLIKELYGVEPNKTGFIDLIVLGADGADATEKFDVAGEKNFVYVPKTVSRGGKVGLGSYVKRNYPRLYVLYPAEMYATESAE